MPAKKPTGAKAKEVVKKDSKKEEKEKVKEKKWRAAKSGEQQTPIPGKPEAAVRCSLQDKARTLAIIVKRAAMFTGRALYCGEIGGEEGDRSRVRSRVHALGAPGYAAGLTRRPLLQGRDGGGPGCDWVAAAAFLPPIDLSMELARSTALVALHALGRLITYPQAHLVILNTKKILIILTK